MNDLVSAAGLFEERRLEKGDGRPTTRVGRPSGTCPARQNLAPTAITMGPNASQKNRFLVSYEYEYKGF